MDRLKETEAKIAELEKVLEAEDARERRVFESVAKVYSEREKVGLGPLAPLLKKVKLEPAEIEEFFKAEEQEARRTVEAAIPALQLTREELEPIDRQVRAIRLINPCLAFLRSWSGCQYHAISCGSTHWETSNALGSCVCNLPNNELNPKVEAFGQLFKGLRSANVRCWLWFACPAPPHPGTVHISTLVGLHGFYILRPAMAMAAADFSLELEMKVFQYGWSWDGAKLSRSWSGDRMGRYDAMEHLYSAPQLGPDPFLVQVSAKLTANAKGGGSLAVGDFATATGNYIKVYYVNPTMTD